jgi:hypothetical protein
MHIELHDDETAVPCSITDRDKKVFMLLPAHFKYLSSDRDDALGRKSQNTRGISHMVILSQCPGRTSPSSFARVGFCHFSSCLSE